MAQQTAVDVELHTGKEVPRDQAEAARDRVASALARYAGRPVERARLTLRHGHKKARHRYVADASVLFEGRTLAAHASGRSPLEAAEAATDRLRDQLRRVVDADVALRNEPRTIEKAVRDLAHRPEYRPEAKLKPPKERRIVHRRPYLDVPLSTAEAVNELLDIDAEFMLFTHADTGEDVVVRRRADGLVGLLHPPGSKLADEDDIVVPEPSPHSEPLTVKEARTEMDWLNHRFLYFIDADDGRGKVIYLRHDGDYGLVEPG